MITQYPFEFFQLPKKTERTQSRFMCDDKFVNGFFLFLSSRIYGKDNTVLCRFYHVCGDFDHRIVRIPYPKSINSRSDEGFPSNSYDATFPAYRWRRGLLS
jgi:hypothetical protein